MQDADRIWARRQRLVLLVALAACIVCSPAGVAFAGFLRSFLREPGLIGAAADLDRVEVALLHLLRGGGWIVWIVLAILAPWITFRLWRKGARQNLILGFALWALAWSTYPLSGLMRAAPGIGAWCGMYVTVCRVASRGNKIVQAIEAYTAEHGRPPPDLDALMPEFLAKIPPTGMSEQLHFEYIATQPFLLWAPVPKADYGAPFGYGRIEYLSDEEIIAMGQRDEQRSGPFFPFGCVGCGPVPRAGRWVYHNPAF